MTQLRIIVDRYKSTHDATLSRVKVVDAAGAVVLQCYGLEDEKRTDKVYGETRIPAGVYQIALRREGGFHQRYRARKETRDVHEGMLHILNVPNFRWILIHIGNRDDDTAGCLLVGAERDEEAMTIQHSAAAYRALYIAVVKAAKARTLTIEFQDNDDPLTEREGEGAAA